MAVAGVTFASRVRAFRQCDNTPLEVPTVLIRPRYFDGQLQTVADFQTAQQSVLEKRRIHNRAVHGSGVIGGLEVSVSDDSDAVIISPGLAIDRLGNEITVEQPQTVILNNCRGGACFVTLRYSETLVDPVPSVEGGTEFSRVLESFTIDATTVDPGPVSDSLVLARLTRCYGKWVVDTYTAGSRAAIT